MRFSVLTALFLLAGVTFSQEWTKMMVNGERDFYKIQEAFYQEWDGKTIDRGSGYKQFKRWEHRMLPRLVDGRYLPDAAHNFEIRLAEKSKLDLARTETDQWVSLGPRAWTNGPNGYNPGIGRVNCIDVHPTDPNTLFVGTPGGGLWKSVDAGANWVPMFEDLTTLGVTDLYINPANPNSMYLLTGDAYGGDTNSIGMYKSSDAGVTWSPSGFTNNSTSYSRQYKMIVNPGDANEIYIAGTDGIMKSTDGGDNWSTLISETTTDIAFKPGDPTIIYASNSNGGFKRSTNSGGSFSTILSNNGSLGRTAIGVSEDNPDYVYMLATNTSSRFGGVYKSTNSGASMSLQSDSPNIFGYSLTADDDRGQGWYDLSIAVNPSNAEDIYVSGIHIWNSKNGGSTWQDSQGNFQVLNHWVYNANNTSNYVHADNHTLDFLNGDLYAGSDGGIWKSTNLGNSWTDLSATLNNTQFYRLGLDPNDENRIVAGAQDNGSYLMDGANWIHLYGADGMEALIDHEDGSTVYTSFQFGGIIRYSNNSAQANITSNLMNTENVSGGWITPYMLDPTDSDIIYLGLEDVWKSTDRGNNWTKLSSFISSSRQLDMAISALDNNYMYTTTGGSLHRTKNGGATWESVVSGLPSASISYVAVSEDDPETVWVTFAGTQSGEKIYQSTNAGISWTNISDGLPNISANCVVHLKGTNNQLYLGTDIGIYQREDGGSWLPWFEGLPNVEVRELEIHYDAGKIRAATYGRGIWERDVSIEGRLELNAISGDQTEVVEGDMVSFTSDYTGTPNEILWTLPGADPSTSSDPNPTVTYVESGLHDVTLQISGVNTPMIILEDYILVHDRVEITSLLANKEEIHLGEDVVFNVKRDGEVDSWNWTFEGGTPSTSIDEFPRVTYNEIGAHDVTVEIVGVNSSVQTFTDFINVLQPLGASLDAKALIAPSVSDDHVTIQISEPESVIEIIDLSGKTILSQKVARGEFSINISNYEKGLYTVRISQNGQVLTGKFVKD